jgi:hypothetical protein
MGGYGWMTMHDDDGDDDDDDDCTGSTRWLSTLISALASWRE